jgi:hypothetical protein
MAPDRQKRDRQTDAIAKMPRRFYTTVQIGLSFPFLFFPFHLHVFSQNLSLLMALQLTLCLHLQSVGQNLRLSAKAPPLYSV